MPQDEATPHEQLFELIGELARRRLAAAERRFAPLGLNHTEARLLKALAAAGGTATQDELSRGLTVDRSNAGRALARLEGAGLTTRRQDEADGRTKLVDITAEGERRAAEVREAGDELARTFFGALSEADAARAIALLQRTA